MWRLVLSFIGIVALAVLVTWLADNPGAVAVDWLGYRVETSFGIALVLGAALVGLVIWAFTRFRWLLSRPSELRRRRAERRREKGLEALSKGMVAVAAGDSDGAARLAREAGGLLADTPLTKLLEAQSAQLGGDEEAAARFFTDMMNDPDTEFLGLRGLIVQAVRKNETDRALKLVERAHELQPASPWAARTLFELQCTSGAYASAERTLASAIKNKVADRDVARRWRTILAFTRAREENAAGSREAALRHALVAADEDPKFVPAVALAADLLRRDDKAKRAAKIIETAWAEMPHPDLAAIYARLVEHEDPVARRRRLAALVRRNRDHRESRLLDGELAIAAQEWEEASKALKPVLESPDPSDRTVRVCMLMAVIAQAGDGDADAARGWLARAAEAPREPVWICGNCGLRRESWAVSCSACGSFDSFEWRKPPEEAPAARIAAIEGFADLLALPAPKPRTPEEGSRKRDAVVRAEQSDEVPTDGDEEREVSPYTPPRPPDDPGPLKDDEDEPAMVRW